MDPPSDKGSESISQVFLNPVLTSDQKTKLNELLHNFGDIFTDKPGRTKVTEIRIETEDVYPIHFPPYRLPMAKLPQLEAEVKQLLQAGVIRPSSSPWASPKSDPFPMPRVDELIDRLGKANMLDLTRGYYQIPVHSNSIPKTAFVTPLGKWEFVKVLHRSFKDS